LQHAAGTSPSIPVPLSYLTCPLLTRWRDRGWTSEILVAKVLAAGEDDGQHGLVSFLATDDIDGVLLERGKESEAATEDVVAAEVAPSGAHAGAPDDGETRAGEHQQPTGQDATKLGAYAAAFESWRCEAPWVCRRLLLARSVQ